MKYTNPIYNKEVIETTDVICESIFTIGYVKTQVEDENGNMVDVVATHCCVE